MGGFFSWLVKYKAISYGRLILIEVKELVYSAIRKAVYGFFGKRLGKF